MDLALSSTIKENEMDDYQALQQLRISVGGLTQTAERRKEDEILQGLKAGQVDPDTLGNRPYEQQALNSWRTSDTAQYLDKYSGMSFDDFMQVDPHKEDNPMHAAIAYNKVAGMLGENEKVQTSMTAARMQKGIQEYQIFDAKRNQINRYLTNGDKDLAGQLAAEVISNSFLPSKAQYDPKTQTIRVYNKNISPDDMGSDLRIAESIPVSEIGKKINDIDGKKYSTAKAMMSAATAKANRESPLKQYINPENGRSIFARSLVDMNDMSKSYLEAYDSKGNPVPIPNEGALIGMGYMPVKGAEASNKIAKGNAEIVKIGAQAGEARAKAYKAIQEGDYAGRDKGKGLSAGGKDPDKAVVNNIHSLFPGASVLTGKDLSRLNIAAEKNAKDSVEQYKLENPKADEKAIAAFTGAKVKEYKKVYLGGEEKDGQKFIDDITGATGKYYKGSNMVVLDPMQGASAGGGKPKGAGIGPDYGYGKRRDGTNKGKGFLGDIGRSDGSNLIMTELSVGVSFNGKEVDIPTIIPTLNKEELEYIRAGKDPRKNDKIMKKAVEHAKARLKAGKSPFAQEGEQPSKPVYVTKTTPQEKAKVSGIAKGLKQESEAAKINGIDPSSVKEPVMDKYGTIWGTVDGHTTRVMMKPSEKIYNGQYDNPEYKQYVDLIKSLGLKI